MEFPKSLKAASETKLLGEKKKWLPSKKIILFAVFVLTALLGFYLWPKIQENKIQEINKNLPAEIRITKNFKNEYSLVNRIDNYEFRIPLEWQGLDAVEYTPERTESEYTGSSIFLMGKEGPSRVLSIDAFKEKEDKELKQWAEDFAKTFSLNITFSETQLAGLSLITSYDEKYLNGTFLFFLKAGQKTYIFSSGSEDYIKEIISNGRWW
ncbi:MAG: hypothetical protein ABIF89_00125 [bacterium]